MKRISGMFLVVCGFIFSGLLMTGCKSAPPKPSIEVQKELVIRSFSEVVYRHIQQIQTQYGVLSLRRYEKCDGDPPKYSELKIVERANKDGVVKKMWCTVVEGEATAHLKVYGLLDTQYSPNHVKYTLYFTQNEMGEVTYEIGASELLKPNDAIKLYSVN